MPAFDTSDIAPCDILTPSALNRQVRDLLEATLPRVWVEGELSNVAHPASGHLYFTLKDNAAQVRCAMFRPRTFTLRFKPIAGMQVLLHARIGLYEPRGEFQLIVEQITQAGEGLLKRQFEQLKTRLHGEGLFDATHKRPLPDYAHRIGVITSPTGAAIRDVISVMARRWPLANLEVLPVPVQGLEAPSAIASMLKKAANCGRYDVLVLTRGGGSLEDLMAFNDETLARTIHASAVPVISAVGHEVDFSIADFVADHRAPTPSAAAELLTPDAHALGRQIHQWQQQLTGALKRHLQDLHQRGDHLFARLQGQRPQVRLAHDRQRLMHSHNCLLNLTHQHQHRNQRRLDHLHVRLCAQNPQSHLLLRRHQLMEHRRRLGQGIEHQLQHHRSTLGQIARALHAISPLATLERGYTILFDIHGKVLRKVAQIRPGEAIRARLADGDCHLHRDAD